MQSLCLNVEVLASDGGAIELRDTDEDVFRAAEELGIDLSRREPSNEAIVKGENIPEPGIPESFKVLIKEMQSLCLNVEVLSSDGAAIEMRDTDEDVFRAAEDVLVGVSH